MGHQEASHRRPTPLERAKSHQRIATYSIAVIVVFIAILVAAALTVGTGETAVERQRLMSVIEPFAQLLLSLATFVLIGNQVSVAVGQIEQAEESEARLLQLTAAARALLAGSPKSSPTTERSYFPCVFGGTAEPGRAETGPCDVACAGIAYPSRIGNDAGGIARPF